MKNNSLLCIFISLLSFSAHIHSQEAKELLSCCAGTDSEAKCTGSASCTACKNCSRCGYCNSGGSCGVCVGRSSYSKSSSRKSESNSNSYYNNSGSIRSSTNSQSSGSNYPYSTPQTSSKSYEMADDVYSEYYGKTLVVNVKEVNLRSGASTNYALIQKLYYMDEVVFLAMKGYWIKVRVKTGNTVGYLHKDYVLVKD